MGKIFINKSSYFFNLGNTLQSIQVCEAKECDDHGRFRVAHEDGFSRLY